MPINLQITNFELEKLKEEAPPKAAKRKQSTQEISSPERPKTKPSSSKKASKDHSWGHFKIA